MHDLLAKLTPLRSGMPLSDVLSLDRLQAIQDLLIALAAGENITARGIGLRRGHGGVEMKVGRQRLRQRQRVCPFGKIVRVDGDTFISGGLIQCGDQNWAMADEEVDTDTDGEWLVSIEVDCEVNRDDDEELLLPGVKTGTKPTAWTLDAWSEGTDYPEDTPPDVADGEATVVLPVGKLTVAGGAARLVETGCGAFTVTHCAGSIGFDRDCSTEE